jgi:ECF transporter S component (folate family)
MRIKERKKLQLVAIAGIFSALSIILGKLLAFNIGELFRVSLENLPIIFVGIAFGPLWGSVVGAVADLVGCLMVGYTINPIITFGAIAIGGISGFMARALSNVSIGKRIFLSVMVSHIVGSVIIKSIGLSWFYGTDFWTLIPYRALNYALIIAIEYTIIYILMKNKEILSRVRSLGENKK